MTLPPLEPRPQEDDSRLALPPVDSIHYGLMREPGGLVEDLPPVRPRVRGSAIEIVLDGRGAPITTGEKGHFVVPYNFSVTEWQLFADAAGSIVIDLWSDKYGNFPPTVADTITGGDLPTLSSVRLNRSTALTGWRLTHAKDDVWTVNVNSATTVRRVTLVLKVIG